MRHIRYRDAQLKALCVLLTPHRIVEVPRIFAINGHKRHVAQIDAMVFIGLCRLLAKSSCLTQYLIWPLPGDAVGADRHVYLKSRIQMIAKHFNHFALGAQRCRRIVGQFDRHELAVTRPRFGLRRNQDVVANARVVREQEANAALLHVTANNLGVRTDQHLNHLPFRAPATIQA